MTIGRRCVVTGQDAAGKAVFVSDSEIEPIASRPGGEMWRMWGDDEAPSLPSDGHRPEFPKMFPPPGGWRYNFVTMAPKSDRTGPGAPPTPEITENMRNLGITDLYEKGDPGRHTTDTIDIDYIVSGELYLELDDGAEVLLKPGDSVIQNGTRHKWHNRGDEPVVMLAVCIGAARS
jgi:mannose-6-phosphate isomerase-like protein (cupin superfamily)